MGSEKQDETRITDEQRAHRANPYACPRHGTVVSDGIVRTPCWDCEQEEPTAPYCEACGHHHDGRCLCPDCGRPVNDPGATHARCPA